MQRLAFALVLGLSAAAFSAAYGAGAASAEGPAAHPGDAGADSATVGRTSDAGALDASSSTAKNAGDAGPTSAALAVSSSTAPASSPAVAPPATSASAEAPKATGNTLRTPNVASLEGAKKPMVRARRRPKARYGAAGCGLGSIIFGTKPGLSQVSAASTNTLGLQTFAITSGTENCDSIDDHETLDNFVAMNREALAKDVARGSGETIVTLTAIAGCADPNTVGPKLKGAYERIFPGPQASTEKVARTIRSILRSDEALGCENLPE